MARRLPRLYEVYYGRVSVYQISPLEPPLITRVISNNSGSIPWMKTSLVSDEEHAEATLYLHPYMELEKGLRYKWSSLPAKMNQLHRVDPEVFFNEKRVKDGQVLVAEETNSLVIHLRPGADLFKLVAV